MSAMENKVTKEGDRPLGPVSDWACMCPTQPRAVAWRVLGELSSPIMCLSQASGGNLME